MQAAPERLDLKRQLAGLLLARGQFAELERLAAPMLQDEIADGEVLHLLGVGATTSGRHALAHQALERATALGYGPSFGALARLLYQLGRDDEALTAGLRALALDPNDLHAAGAVVRVLLGRGEKERVWMLCQRIRAAGGWGAFIPSAMALSARSDAERREVEQLVGRETWFERTALGLTTELRHQIGEALLRLMSSSLPRHKASTGSGRRVDQLQLARTAAPVVDELFDAMRFAVESYIAARASMLGDRKCSPPMGPRSPEALSLDSWAIATNRDGHESWHMHPSGWLSGVYYVQVPELASSVQPHAGEIEFGPYPFGASAETSAWPTWRVRPEPDDLLLFPSSYGHRTWPTGVEEDRIIVAFDVLLSG